MHIECEKEFDGRWIAEVNEISGVLAYGRSRDEAIAKVQALPLRVIADKIENGEDIPDIKTLFAIAV